MTTDLFREVARICAPPGIDVDRILRTEAQKAVAGCDGEYPVPSEDLADATVLWSFDQKPSKDEPCVVNLLAVVFYDHGKEIGRLPVTIFNQGKREVLEADIAAEEDGKAMQERIDARDDYGDWLFEQRKDREASR
jgi:hypothetical protein